jgi:SAM-dependent methyltransferase
LLVAAGVPTIQQNYERWQQHKWAQSGDEWSPGRCPEGTAILWSRTILPRIERYFSAGTVLEIGPGFGRWTEFLRRVADRMILVDLSDRCIESCRRRFAGDSRISYFVNDGASLDVVPDGSVDFIFSFDSLVHAEADAIGAYLSQAARKLKPGGAGFIHHSNLGAFVGRRGRVPWFVTEQHWRGASMSADIFAGQCRRAGLHCCSQELINWLGRAANADRHRLPGPCLPLIDCLSVFTNESCAAAPVRIVNYSFVDEWRQAVWMADVYYRGTHPSPDLSAAAAALTPVRKLATARALLRHSGYRAVIEHAWRRARSTSGSVLSAGVAHVAGEANRWYLNHRLLRS